MGLCRWCCLHEPSDRVDGPSRTAGKLHPALGLTSMVDQPVHGQGLCRPVVEDQAHASQAAGVDGTAQHLCLALLLLQPNRAGAVPFGQRLQSSFVACSRRLHFCKVHHVPVCETLPQLAQQACHNRILAG